MSDVTNVSEMFGKNVFNDSVMRERLPKSVYKKLKKTIEDGTAVRCAAAHGGEGNPRCSHPPQTPVQP